MAGFCKNEENHGKITAFNLLHSMHSKITILLYIGN